jgi:DNA-binding transcriptional ArsR family regulator
MGRAVVRKLRDAAWLRMLRKRHVVLIDTPDYSKTDRRLMEKDLEEIYWLWNTLARSASFPHNLIVAIQKEMFRGHFFFDKMRSIELKPLKPGRMVEAYRHQFNSLKPFTPEALLAVARMSRGIFRRFLRYITLTLDLWEDRHRGSGDHIDVATAQAAVTTERLAEDMELELSELFPKHSDLRLLAVRLLMLLEKSGERKQSELADLLDVEPYMLSRLLTRLEGARYVKRRREGNDKIVSLYSQKNNPAVVV